MANGEVRMVHILAFSFLLVAWLVATAAATPIVLKRVGLVRTNFLGRNVPVGLGWAVILWACPVLLLDPWHLWPWRQRVAFAVLLVGFGLLGFADDVLGDRSATGIRGHLRQLKTHRRITTGLIKAAGIPILALWVVWLVLRRPLIMGLWDALIVSLGANCSNLLDLRPGRACAVFLVLGGALVVSPAIHHQAPPLVAILITAASIYPFDALGRAMLGDTGSNVLGGALALQFVLQDTGWLSRSIATALLVLIHVAAERYSLTAVIEAHPILSRLDAFTGVRRPPRADPAEDEPTRK